MGAARLASLSAQNALRSANASLTRLVGAQAGVTAVAADTNEVPRIEVDSVELGRLAEQGPGVRQATASLEASRGARRASLTSYLPFVTASYGYSTNKSSQNFDWGGGPAATGTSYGFSLNYNIFNNFSRELNLMNATVTEENAQISLRDAKLAARENLALYLGAFRTAAQTIELQLLQIAAAEEGLHAQQSRYALGASALLEALIGRHLK